MKLTGQEIIELKVSDIRECVAKLSSKMTCSKFHPVAQRKMVETFKNMKAVLDGANDAIKELDSMDKESEEYKDALDVIESSIAPVTIYRLEVKNFSIKNRPLDHLDLEFMCEVLQ